MTKARADRLSTPESLPWWFGRQARPEPPSRHIGTKGVVLGAKSLPQGWFLVSQNKNVTTQPDQHAIAKENDIPKDGSLTENQEHNC
jgi:hypothetical protein